MKKKKKRDNQELYDGNYNQNLIEEMKRAKDLCFEYNNIKPSEREKRKEFIKKIFPYFCVSVIVGVYHWIFHPFSYGNISVVL